MAHRKSTGISSASWKRCCSSSMEAGSAQGRASRARISGSRARLMVLADVAQGAKQLLEETVRPGHVVGDAPGLQPAALLVRFGLPLPLDFLHEPAFPPPGFAQQQDDAAAPLPQFLQRPAQPCPLLLPPA